MALGQSLQQRLLQKFSPQQIQLMKLLTVPTAELEERIQAELEQNPALELAENEEDYKQEELKDEFDSDNDDDDYDLDGSADEYENLDLNEYINDSDDDIADYKLKDDNYPEINDKNLIPIKNEVSFQELLLQQLGLLSLTLTETTIAEQIIGSIDDDGYLRRETQSIVDDLAFRQNVITDVKTVEKLIQQIQLFDPPGIGARNLQECLLLQLRRTQPASKKLSLEQTIVKNYFEEFTKKHYEKIIQGLNIMPDKLKEALAHITKLNPKPGGIYSSSSEKLNYIIPDFYVFNNNGKLELSVNKMNEPALRISADYKDMLRTYDTQSKTDKRQKEAVQFIKQKIDGAKWFIDAIKQRQHTLYNTMSAIMERQQNFFLTGDEAQLRPMILKDIAAITNLDISTISRVANSKYVQTEYGNFKLKYFFTEAMTNDSGEEVTIHEIKKHLTDILQNEDKLQPINDDKLTELVNAQGYNLARRTIAKYREQMGIPVARLRKQL
jgi:RNA polymerase sigma-54 factor